MKLTKKDISTIIIGIIVLIIGIVGIRFYKYKLDEILHGMNNQIEIYAFEESIDFKKQQEERERLVEAVKFVNSVLKEAIAVEIEERNTVRIAFFGDLIYDRQVSKKLDTKEKFDDFFSKNPLVFPEGKDKINFDFIGFNLETPVVSELTECQPSQKEIKFCSKDIFLPWIKELGFNTFALANNHAMDGGTSGHNATIRNLDEIGVDYFGSIKHGTYLDKTYAFTGTIKDVPFSWHSYDFTIYGDTHLNTYCDELKAGKLLGYNNFVVTHWGTEYQYMAHSKTQENLAKKLIDCGADLIIGMHPHVIQDYEYYNGKLIIYSLGNFLFDQNWSKNTQKGIGVFIEYRQNGETKFESIERKSSV